MKDTIESLVKQEKELEEKMLGTPSEEETTEPEATEELAGAEEALVKEEELVTPEPEPATDEQPEPKTEDWEKRYKNLRSSRDEKLYKTKAQLAASLETISTLQAELNELRKRVPAVDPLKDIFTAEDTDALGDTTVEAMQRLTRKATDAATAPLKEQLAREQELRQKEAKRLAEQAKQEAYNIFLSRVAQAVPDWEDINYDPAFEQFMNEPDLDGIPRKTYFAEAEAHGNSAQVIKYMLEFKESNKKPVKEDKLAKKVNPVGDDAGATQVKEKKPEMISQAFIEKFYDDLSRGRYKGRYSEAQAIEAAIDKATMEGRIVR